MRKRQRKLLSFLIVLNPLAVMQSLIAPSLFIIMLLKQIFDTEYSHREQQASEVKCSIMRNRFLTAYFQLFSCWNSKQGGLSYGLAYF